MPKKGFTLIELLVVVVIIAILAAIAFPQYQKAVEKSRWADAIISMSALADAWERSHLTTGQYTTNMNDLDITVPPSQYFNTPTLHASPPHIERLRTGVSGLYILIYSSTKSVYCVAANSNAKHNKFCAEYTGQAGVPCPPPDDGGYTCYRIK